MQAYTYSLAKKGKYRCPNCEHDRKFVRYVSTETGEQLHNNCGKCDRSDNCGYHYTPKQYFADNPTNTDGAQFTSARNTAYRTAKLLPQKEISFIDKNDVIESLKKYENNNFVIYLHTLFDSETVEYLCEKYFIGTAKHWNGATVFYQIDIGKNVHTGKVFLYDTKTGKRNKEKNNWVHSLLKDKQHEFTLQQCFFGEHLLSDTSKTVAIFESEKTAIIASVYYPECICIATSGKHGLSANKYAVLQNRNVVLFPDISKKKDGKSEPTAFELWSNKAIEIERIANSVFVSDTLERMATDGEKLQGLDIADYLLQIPLSEFLAAKQASHHATTNETNEPPPCIVEPCEPLTDSHNEPPPPNVVESCAHLPRNTFDSLRAMFPNDAKFAEFLTAEIAHGQRSKQDCTMLLTYKKELQTIENMRACCKRNETTIFEHAPKKRA